MKTSRMNTGNEQLDSDLKALFAFLSSSKKGSAATAIKDHSLSERELIEHIPLPVIRIAYALTEARNFKSILDDARRSIRPSLKKARALVKREFPGLTSHPSVQGVITRAVRRTTPLKLNVIRRMNWSVQWWGTPPELTPAIRVGFLDKNDELLLDTSMDWDDALYVINSLSEMVRKQMEVSSSLAKAKLLDLPDRSQLIEKVERLRTNTESLIAAAAKIGLGIELTNKNKK